MTCGCRELEATHGNGKCKCSHYREQFPDCKCEEESVSEYSPGRVCDNEVLIRAIFRSDYVDQRGCLKPTYFQNVVRDFTVRGLSVNRKGHVTEPDLKARLRHHPSNIHGYLGFIAATCGDLRRLRFNGSRAFCVYDSATEEDRSHADVCQSVSPEPSATRRESRTLRMKTARMLQDEFCRTVTMTLANAVPRLDRPTMNITADGGKAI